MSDILKETVYSKNSIEFTTVAVQYCALLESDNEMSFEEFVDKMTKVLPLLYLKATLIPQTEMTEEDELEVTVTESHYNFILNKIYNILRENDTYLEVFMEDMKYSETPIAASISEDLTDIYQDLKNFAAIFERGVTELMNDALYICLENFESYWGQKLVNVLRALHSLKYSENTLEEDNLSTENIDSDIW